MFGLVTKKSGAVGVAEVVELLCSNCEALSSITSIAKKIKINK
jgi:hypothetical protein